MHTDDRSFGAEFLCNSALQRGDEDAILATNSSSPQSSPGCSLVTPHARAYNDGFPVLCRTNCTQGEPAWVAAEEVADAKLAGRNAECARESGIASKPLHRSPAVHDDDLPGPQRRPGCQKHNRVGDIVGVGGTPHRRAASD